MHKIKRFTRNSLRDLNFYLREIIYRMPNLYYLIGYSIKGDMATRSSKNYLNILCDDGIVRLENFIQGSHLAAMKNDFDKMIEKIENENIGFVKHSPDGGHLHPSVEYITEEYKEDIDITISNDPIKYSSLFLQFALNKYIREILSGYFKKTFSLQQVTAYRTYPRSPEATGSFQWHHDAWGKKINIMLLLTDVGPSDQYMTYLKGSHTLLHSRNDTLVNSRISPAFFEKKKITETEIYQCIGKAGTVFIFDANGIHSGNRSNGATRDVITFQYNAGRYQWDIEIPKEFNQYLNSDEFNFLSKNINLKKWL